MTGRGTTLSTTIVLHVATRVVVIACTLQLLADKSQRSSRRPQTIALAMRRPLFVLAAGSLSPFPQLPLLIHPVRALSSAPVAQRSRHGARPPPGAKVTASPVQTQADLVALADLRYDEWIANDDVAGAYASDAGDDPSSLSSSNPLLPSRYAFRMATAEIVAERTEGGAVAFLAGLRMPPPTNNDGGNDVNAMYIPVGAAELSPIEFDGAITLQQSENDDAVLPTIVQPPTRLYVSDVVTSSRHRRMGIANTLMDALELFALDKFGADTMLYLHVKKENVAARKFYENPKRGYAAPTSKQLEHIDIGRLEDNAGTAGQILMCKSLDCGQLEKKNTKTRGFGVAAASGRIPKKSNKRNKR
jgi:ribosomal protein S18 acetylase RimI-like enzyme